MHSTNRHQRKDLLKMSNVSRNSAENLNQTQRKTEKFTAFEQNCIYSNSLRMIQNLPNICPMKSAKKHTNDRKAGYWMLKYRSWIVTRKEVENIAGTKVNNVTGNWDWVLCREECSNFRDNKKKKPTRRIRPQTDDEQSKNKSISRKNECALNENDGKTCKSSLCLHSNHMQKSRTEIIMILLCG